MFYQVIDDIFDNLFDKYGLEIDIIDMKEKLIYAYENEERIKALKICKAITPKMFIINNEGNVEYLKTC